MPANADAVTPTTTVKFHISLWVADLTRAVSFYRALFGQEPHKHHPDYAKFELDQPPVVLSFLQQPAPKGASLNHVGLRLPDPAGLVAIQRRLEQAGYPTLREDGVACCYSLQTKFWATDPDGVRWEVYAIHDDIAHHGKTRTPQPVPDAETEAAPTDGIWTHTIPDAFPERLPFEDASLDEVKLLGTFNASGGTTTFLKALTEVSRVLRPGGRLLATGLVGDRRYPGEPDFPGLSAKYKSVPQPPELLGVFVAAGFRGTEIASLKDVGCVKDSTGVVFRMATLTAWKTTVGGPPATTARYDGPFARLTDDDGTAFPRGVSVPVSVDQVEQLRNGPMGSAFTFGVLN